MQFQDVPISFTQGIDTKSDPKQLQTKLVSLVNASMQTPGEFKKRPGFQTLIAQSPAGVLTTTFQDELVSGNGRSLHSYSPETGVQVLKNLFTPIALSTSSVVRNTSNQANPDSAYHSGTGLKIYTWLNTRSGTTELMYSIVDTTTGTVIMSEATAATNATKAKVLCLGSLFYIIFYDTVAKLVFRTISTTTPTVITGNTTISTAILEAGGVVHFDAVVSGSNIYVAYPYNSGTDVRFNSISLLSVVSSPYTVAVAEAINSALSITYDGSGNIWLAYGTSGFLGDVRALIVNSTLTTTVLARTTIEAGINTANITLSVTGTTGTIYYEGYSGAVSNYIRSNTLTLTGTVGTAVTIMRGLGLASKVFVVGGYRYMLAVYAGQYLPDSLSSSVLTTIEPTYFLLLHETNGAHLMGKLAPSVAGLYYTTGLLPEALTLSSGVVTMAYLTRTQLAAIDGQVAFRTGFFDAQWDFNYTAPPAIEFGQNLHLGSGQLWMYDGTSVVEHGFHLFPENLAATSAVTGGGLGSTLYATTVNQVQYVAVYEWIDHQGQLHRSAPSLPLTVTLPVASTITAVTFTATATISSNVLTSVSSFTNLVVGQVLNDTTNATTFDSGVYITNINTGSSTVTLSGSATASHVGDTFSTKDRVLVTLTVPTLRATEKEDVSIALYRTQNNQSLFYRCSSLTSLVYNDVGNDTVTIQDALPDSILVGNEQLYTTGGEVDNIAAPAISSLGTFKNRLIYTSPENPLQWGFSKQVITGVPVEFNSQEFVQSVDSRIGRISALGVLDDKLILFGPNSKFYVVGDGPAPSGINNDFSQATKITGTTGCERPNSVLELPIGLLYQDTHRGIWLLDRSLQEQYIGAGVEAYNGSIVTSAHLVPGKTQARLALNSGVVLVLDYTTMQWETDVYSSAVVDATLFEDAYTYIVSTGEIYQQTTSFVDNTAAIPLSLKSGWMAFSGSQNLMRVRELMIFGEYKSPHTLTVKVYTDFVSTAVQTATIPVLTDPGVYQFKISMKVQKCEAIQIEILETPQLPYGEGLSLSGMAFRVGLKVGLNNLPATKGF